jgi:hypothetical protein
MISPEEFVERLCRLGADRGPRKLPRKRRDREILMKSILMTLESSRTYTEAEVNGALGTWQRDVGPAIETDHVTLRRLLVDHGHLERTADGKAYRVGYPARPVAFDREVDDIDVRATIAAYRDHLERRRRRGRPASEVADGPPAEPLRRT